MDIWILKLAQVHSSSNIFVGIFVPLRFPGTPSQFVGHGPVYLGALFAFYSFIRFLLPLGELKKKQKLKAALSVLQF